MKRHFVLEVELTLLGPILTRGSQMPKPGIDAPMARDSMGRYMLPFSLIKGKARDALLDLQGVDSSNIHDWLGKQSDEGAFEPERGRLRFSDFYTENPGKKNGVIQRIQIDEATGAASERMLAMLEAPFGYEEPVVFQGKVEFIADQAEAQQIRQALNEALHWIPAYGAMRTVGFGRTKSVAVNLKEIQEPTSQGNPPAANQLPFELHLDRPLCIVGAKHSRNHFESLQNISGAVLKGATARLICELNGAKTKVIDPQVPFARFPKLCEHFERLRFTEARPREVGTETRSVIPPVSLVTSPARPQQWFDVALETEPLLIGGVAPAFHVDWKDEDRKLVNNDFSLPRLPSERRTRTAIERTTGRAADEQLFSYGLVQPKTLEKEYVWEALLELPLKDGSGKEIPDSDRQAMRTELAELLSFGLPNIGKTRAVASLTWLREPTRACLGQTPISDNLHVVTLQTDCLMTDPSLLESGSLFAAYESFWNEISEGSLKLVRFFAQQTLHGGFLAKRHGQTNGSKYDPFLLTDRGGVFVLQMMNSSNGTEFLRQWETSALPTPDWVVKRYAQPGKPLWQGCPFLREVGFGEIAVDLACHHQRPGNQDS